MDSQIYKQRVLDLPIGKKLNKAHYVFKDSLNESDKKLYNFVNNIEKNLELLLEYNVIKFNRTEFKISFLLYPIFFKVPHPF